MFGKKHRLFIFLGIAIILTIFVRYSYDSGKDIQKAIAGEIIRFHVRANSDSEEDQQLKLQVKDAVVTYLSPMLSDSESTDESRQILSDHIDDITRVATDTLRSLGSDEEVSVYFEKSYFPMKVYGDMTFPPGEYEAFRIDIGQADGKNWWCVLYPPLCFIDAAYAVVPEDSKETLKNVLTEEEYSAITNTQYKYEFKLIDAMKSIFKGQS
jgi:stage II sporulation protein R